MSAIPEQNNKINQKKESAEKKAVKKRIKPKYILLILITALLIYIRFLFLHEPDYVPKAWESYDIRNRSEGFESITPVSEMHTIDISPYSNPETVVYHDGYLYASVDESKIIRIKEDGSDLKKLLSTDGKILGFEVDDEDTIWFTDVYHSGVYRADSANHYQIETVVSGAPLNYPDAICLSKDQSKIYISDATVVKVKEEKNGAVNASNTDLLAHTMSGRVYCYDLNTKELTEIASGFSFCNGIQLSEDEKYLYVNETSGNRIWKVNIQNKDKEIFLDALPGFPDNMSERGEGIYWTGFASPENVTYTSLSNKVLLRKVILNLPYHLRNILMNTGDSTTTFFAFNEEGEILYYVNTDQFNYGTTTGIIQVNSRLYIHHLNGSQCIGYIDLQN